MVIMELISIGNLLVIMQHTSRERIRRCGPKWYLLSYPWLPRSEQWRLERINIYSDTGYHGEIISTDQQKKRNICNKINN